MSPVLSADCSVSVIIPTRNRPGKIAACLEALDAQVFPHERFEVIVVDDGSDESIAPVIAPFRESLRLRLIEQANAGPARARNAGAARASGALLAFTDDDCRPSANWLSALHAKAQARPDTLIGGHTVNAQPDNVHSVASQMLVDYLYDYYATATAPDGAAPSAPPFFTSNNVAIPANLFAQVGGFGESFPLAAGEDRELCDRWQEHGYQLLHDHDAVVKHAHALSLARFWRQHVNYGRGAWHLRHARKARGRSPIRLEPLSFYGRLLSYPLRAAPRGKAPQLIALLFLSQVANTVGFVSERFRRP